MDDNEPKYSENELKEKIKNNEITDAFNYGKVY